MNKSDKVNRAFVMVICTLLGFVMILVGTCIGYEVTGGYGYEYAFWYNRVMPFLIVQLSIIVVLVAGNMFNSIIQLEEF